MTTWQTGDLRGLIACDDCGTLALEHRARQSGWLVYSTDVLHYAHRCRSCAHSNETDCRFLYGFDQWAELTRIRLRGDQ